MSRRYSVFQQSKKHASKAYTPTTHEYPLNLYMDESGNGNKDCPLLVGAIATDVDAADIEAEIRRLHEELSARRALKGLPTFEEFRKHGFHAKNDPLEVANPFLELLQRTVGFKSYVYYTDRSTLPDVSESQQLENLYAILVADNLIRYRFHSEAHCVIEENNQLRGLVQTLPDLATKKALERLGREIPLPNLRVRMAKKGELMSIAIIDYVMMAISRWIRGGYLHDVSDRKYRNFLEIAPTLSLLYSLEQGPILNRKNSPVDLQW